MLLGFVNNWLAPRANPIGVDIGATSLRLAQVQLDNTEPRLIAAAMSDAAGDLSGLLRDCVKRGNFHGRQAIISLPAHDVHVHHLRLPKMDDEAIKKALPWELKGKIPINPGNAMIRHIIAGEIYNNSEPQMEIVCFATAREKVDELLSAAAKAKLDVIGMAVPQLAVIDCFGHVYRRQADRQSTTCYIQLGAQTTRVIIAHHLDILFSRTIASSPSPGLSRAEPRGTPAEGRPVPSTAGGGEGRPLDISGFIEELTLCRRYHESNFPKNPIDRLLFIGGGACNRELCQEIARQMNLPAQLGDPMVRLNKASAFPENTCIDRRQPQPAWCVALGLSMGSARVKETV